MANISPSAFLAKDLWQLVDAAGVKRKDEITVIKNLGEHQ